MEMTFHRKLPIPKEVKAEYSLTERMQNVKAKRDAEIRAAFDGSSDKFILIIGPCSADREDAVLDYIYRLREVEEKVKDIYLLINQGEIIGSIACYGNEIDDLIVNKKFQHKGYGKQLLLWGMQCIRKKNTEPIVLHVAEWNKNALLLYKKNGFEITNIEKIR